MTDDLMPNKDAVWLRCIGIGPDKALIPRSEIERLQDEADALIQRAAELIKTSANLGGTGKSLAELENEDASAARDGQIIRLGCDAALPPLPGETGCDYPACKATCSRGGYCWRIPIALEAMHKAIAASVAGAQWTAEDIAKADAQAAKWHEHFHGAQEPAQPSATAHATALALDLKPWEIVPVALAIDAAVAAEREACAQAVRAAARYNATYEHWIAA